MSKLALLGCLLVATALPAAGHPAYVPVIPAVALVQADPGRTTLVLTSSASGWSLSLARSVSAACDVVAIATPAAPFDLRLRARLVRELSPFHLSAEFGWSGIMALGALHLGPIRIVGERRWGEEAGRGVSVLAARPGLSVAVGARDGESPGAFAAVSWLPKVIPLWSLSLAVSLRGLEIGVGGTW